MKLRSISLAVLMSGVVSLSGFAAADTINGTVWQNQNPYKAGVVLAAPTGSSTSFTVSAIDFNSDSTGYTIGTFLSPSLTSVLPSSVANASLNNTILEFTGTTYLTQNQTYTITHDDGMYLFIGTTYAGKILVNPSNNANSSQNNNNMANHTGEVINAGSPTSAEDSSFTWTGASGSYSFDLLYTEVNGAPGVLNAPNFPTSVTPEPSSLILIGTGLLSAAGALRRRFSL